MLLFRILQQIQESQAATQATLSRLERAATRHDWKFAETEQRFSRLEKCLDDIQADIRDTTDKLKSVIKLEIGKQAEMLKRQVGCRVQGQPGP